MVCLLCGLLPFSFLRRAATRGGAAGVVCEGSDSARGARFPGRRLVSRRKGDPRAFSEALPRRRDGASDERSDPTRCRGDWLLLRSASRFAGSSRS